MKHKNAVRLPMWSGKSSRGVSGEKGGSLMTEMRRGVADQHSGRHRGAHQGQGGGDVAEARATNNTTDPVGRVSKRLQRRSFSPCEDLLTNTGDDRAAGSDIYWFTGQGCVGFRERTSKIHPRACASRGRCLASGHGCIRGEFGTAVGAHEPLHCG